MGTDRRHGGVSGEEEDESAQEDDNDHKDGIPLSEHTAEGGGREGEEWGGREGRESQRPGGGIFQEDEYLLRDGEMVFDLWGDRQQGGAGEENKEKERGMTRASWCPRMR